MKKFYAPLICWLLSAVAAVAQPTIGFSSFITGLTAPVDIVNAHDGSNRLFIVQQNGIVRLRKTTGMVTRPFLNMSALITYSGEQGLLSIAFHPQYATNRYLFVYYNNTAGNVELAQYRTSATDPDSVDVASRKVMLTITKPYTNHNGCKLNFGPDSLLYFGTGDGGSGGDPNNYAQNLNSYLGKMLRIRVDSFTTSPYYTVPSSNPLVGMSSVKTEIYDWGLRNPWRWNFDRQTGDMWIADVGQGAWEEVNMIPAASTNGLNFGWRCYEGNHSYDLSSCGATPLSGKTFPIFEYGHSSAGGYSITGGLVYRGTQYPALQGYYLCADYVTTNGWLIKQSGSTWTTTKQTNFPANVSTFGDAEDGTLYLASLGGTVYQVTASAALGVRELSFSAHTISGQDVLSWSCTYEPALSGLEVLRTLDGEHYETVARLLPAHGGYRFVTPALPAERFYRIRALYSNGSSEYSATVRMQPAAGPTAPFVTSAPGQIWLNAPTGFEEVILMNAQGQRVRQYASLPPGRKVLSTEGISPGIYLLQCRGAASQMATLRTQVQ